MSGWHDAAVDGVGTAVDDWGANDVDVVDGGADVADEGAGVNVVDEGADGDVET